MKKFESLEDKIESTIAPVKITSLASHKGDLVARRVKDICEALKFPTYEVAFYLLTSQEDAKTGIPVIRDIYIAKNQNVFQDYCTIPGDGGIDSQRDIRNNLKMRIAGWGHSHGNLTNFFSPRDYETFGYFVENNRLFLEAEFEKWMPADIHLISHKGKNFIQIGTGTRYLIHTPEFDKLNSSKVHFDILDYQKKEVKYSYGIVFNAKNDRPYAIVGYKIGDNVRFIKDASLEHVIDNSPIDLSTDTIDEQIKSRVIQIRNRIAFLRTRMDKDYEAAAELLGEARKLSAFGLSERNGTAVLERIRDSIHLVERMRNDYKSHNTLEEFAEFDSRLYGALQETARYMVGQKNLIFQLQAPIRHEEEQLTLGAVFGVVVDTFGFSKKSRTSRDLLHFIEKYRRPSERYEHSGIIRADTRLQ